LSSILHVRDALRSERVCPQVTGRVVLVQSRRFLHPSEERAHAGNVETRLLQELKADSVRFAFEVARVIQLRLNAGCTCSDNERLRQIGTRAGGKQPDDDRRKSRN